MALLLIKKLKTELIFKGNRFKDIATAWTVGFGPSVFGFVYDSEYVNVTTGKLVMAVVFLMLLIMAHLLEFSRSVIPTTGAWKIRVIGLRIGHNRLGVLCVL